MSRRRKKEVEKEEGNREEGCRTLLSMERTNENKQKPNGERDWPETREGKSSNAYML